MTQISLKLMQKLRENEAKHTILELASNYSVKSKVIISCKYSRTQTRMENVYDKFYLYVV